LTEELVKTGAHVTVLAKPNDPAGMESIKHLLGNLNVLHGDINSIDVCREAVKHQDLVFHLAAETQVAYCLKFPRRAFKVNALGTLNLLEAIRVSSSDPFMLHASTDKVYGDPQYLPIDENHPLNPKSPYEASKLAGEKLVEAWHSSYGVRCCILRWSNTIGGRDANYLRIVPDVISSLLSGQAPIIRGTGKHVRDYMYVDDTVKSLFAVASNVQECDGQVFNVGTGKPTTVIELTELLIKLMGYEGKVKLAVLNRQIKGEIDTQYLSSKKIRGKLGFVPRFDLESSLRLTIEWYRRNPWWLGVMTKVREHYQKTL